MTYSGIWLKFFASAACLTKRGEGLVDAIATDSLRPDRWGGDPPREAFSRTAFLKDIRAEDYNRFCLQRTTVPKWFGCYSEGGAWFQFNAPLAKKWWPEIFDWSDQLAEVFQPVFGACHPVVVSEDCIHNNWSVAAHYEVIRLNGLPWLGGRTYLGRRLVKAITMDVLQSSGIAKIVEYEWGVKLDLVEEPWTVSETEFVSRQSVIMRKLSSTGLFGEYGLTSLDVEPGRKWKRSILPAP